VLHELVAYHVAQLVADVGQREILVGRAHRAALERNYLEPGRGQLLRHDAAGPAQPDDDGIDLFQLGRHVVLPQLMSEMATGSAGIFLSRYFTMFSRCTAIAPGKPISRQPALLRLPPWIGSANMPSITV